MKIWSHKELVELGKLCLLDGKSVQTVRLYCIDNMLDGIIREHVISELFISVTGHEEREIDGKAHNILYDRKWREIVEKNSLERGTLTFIDDNNYNHEYKEGKWFVDKDRAIDKVRSAINKRLNSLRHQIHRLENTEIIIKHST